MRFCTILFFIFIACNKSDDAVEQTITQQIIGTWQVNRFVIKEYGQITSDNLANDCQTQSRTTFYEDGTYTDLVYGGVVGNCESNTYEYLYSIVGGVMDINVYENSRYISIVNDVLEVRWSICSDECDRWNVHYYTRIN